MSPSLSSSAATPRNVRLLYLHNFLCDFRFQAAFLVIYFNQIAGSYAAAMSVLVVETLTSAVMDVPTGVFSDRVGRKYTIALGSMCCTLSMIFYATAQGLQGLVVGAMFYGLGSCLFSGNNTALLYESLKTEGREGEFSHYQGRASGMFQLALGLSALCGGLLSGHGLRFVFALGIVPQFLSILVCFFFREPRIHVPHPHGGLAHLREVCVEAWRNKRLRWLILGQAISYGAGESTFTSKSAFVNMLWPTWAVGIYRGLNHFLGFAAFWFAGKLLERVKPPAVMIAAEAYWFVTQGIAVLLANIFSPVLMTIEACAYGPYMIARDKLLQSEFTDVQRATMGSVASFMGSIVYAIAALAIGVISDRFGIVAAIGFGTCFCALSLPVYIYLFRRSF